MQADIEQALSPLLGLPLWGVGRAANVAWFHFGERRVRDGIELGAYALHVSTAWRLAGPDGILIGAADLFTPADPDADLEAFDWSAPGTTWLDVRAKAFKQAVALQPVFVEAVGSDPCGSLRLGFTGGLALEVFPESSPANHVETEFWRLFQPGTPAHHFVVETSGIHHDSDA